MGENIQYILWLKMQTENTELVPADLQLTIEDKEIDIMSHGVW